MATEPLAGRRMTRVTERRTRTDRAQFLADIAARCRDATRITLVMDNLNTHRPGSLYDAYPPEQAKALWDPIEFVYTPKHGSWLNVAEVEFNVMNRQCLNRRIDSMDVLAREVAAWQASRDRIQARVDWQFTAEDARLKEETVSALKTLVDAGPTPSQAAEQLGIGRSSAYRIARKLQAS